MKLSIWGQVLVAKSEGSSSKRLSSGLAAIRGVNQSIITLTNSEILLDSGGQEVRLGS